MYVTIIRPDVLFGMQKAQRKKGHEMTLRQINPHDRIMNNPDIAMIKSLFIAKLILILEFYNSRVYKCESIQ